MKYELRQMRKQGSGAIVNNSSLRRTRGHCRAGRVSLPPSNGVLGLTNERGSRIYASMGVRINAICPGINNTPMVSGMLATQAEAMKELMKEVRLGDLVRPEEIAARRALAVAALAQAS